MKIKGIVKYLWMFLLIVLLVFFAIMAVKGKEIHEKICPKVKSARVKTIIYEDKSYNCIERNCVRDGKVYEIYKQKSFFNENTRVKAVEVEILEIETKDIPETKDMVAIVSGIDSISRQYFAVVPKEGLTDGETVTISE